MAVLTPSAPFRARSCPRRKHAEPTTSGQLRGNDGDTKTALNHECNFRSRHCGRPIVEAIGLISLRAAQQFWRQAGTEGTISTVPTVDIVDLLRDERLDLPRTRGGEDYLDFLGRSYEEFVEALSSVDGTDPYSQCVRASIPVAVDVAEGVVTALEDYLSGFPARAYTSLASRLDASKDVLAGLMLPNDKAWRLQRLFRMRTAGAPALSRAEMFHPPFEKRDLVSSQRYSIPGHPCLYLGGSPFVCWMELEKPALSEMHLSLFRASKRKPVRVVNFSHRPALLGEALKDWQRQGGAVASFLHPIRAHVICWPLLAACSMRVPNRSVRFKVEYVIPQLLLQWIRESKYFDGVRYYSTHVSAHMRDPFVVANFAFPAKSMQRSGYCAHLNELFDVSEPVRGPTLDAPPSESRFGPAFDGLAGDGEGDYSPIPSPEMQEMIKALEIAQVSRLV